MNANGTSVLRTNSYPHRRPRVCAFSSHICVKYRVRNDSYMNLISPTVRFVQRNPIAAVRTRTAGLINLSYRVTRFIITVYCCRICY